MTQTRNRYVTVAFFAAMMLSLILPLLAFFDWSKPSGIVPLIDPTQYAIWTLSWLIVYVVAVLFLIDYLARVKAE